MAKFLSNDRKVILKSAAAGVGIISLLSLVLLTESMILWGLALFGVLAVYCFIPTWFSRNHQLIKKEDKYFNIDGREIRKLSDKEEIISFILFFLISFILIVFIYGRIIDILISIYPTHEIFFSLFLMFIAFCTPFLIRHFYCFIFNRPMDTSLVLKGNGTSYIHKYDDSRSHVAPHSHKYDHTRSFATNPVYSSLSCNIYNHRR